MQLTVLSHSDVLNCTIFVSMAPQYSIESCLPLGLTRYMPRLQFIDKIDWILKLTRRNMLLFVVLLPSPN